MSHRLQVVASDAFTRESAVLIARYINAAVADTGACSIALSGGNTPRAIYQELVSLVVPWGNVSIFFGDERAVPPDSAESNYAMTRTSLLDRVAIDPARIHRMAAERADIDAAALEYEQRLPSHLDLLLLGIGPDGHTASLFPGTAAAEEMERRVLGVPPPAPPLSPRVARMTITPPVIDAARQTIMMVQGADKAAILQRILEGPADPVALPAQRARRGIWIVDRAAATQLHAGEE